jgi:hypothetical protein
MLCTLIVIFMDWATSMKTVNEILTEIARLHLIIPTLEARNSDSLDFHECSVWAIKRALKEAYETGLKNRDSKR